MERSRRLDDDALAEEIELYGDLVVAASEADGALATVEIDRLLGLVGEGDDAGGAATGAGGAEGAGS